jgi:hypothetical protein
MTSLETLALKLATAWHEMQRNTDELTSGSLSQVKQQSTQIHIEHLADLMDIHKEEVFKHINTLN